MGLGFSANQLAYIYQQMAQCLGFTSSAAWATGSTYEQAANLGMGNLRTQALRRSGRQPASAGAGTVR